MDLRALRYFVCVADNRSFSKAAVMLHIGQSALSRSVMRLEEDLGVKLFRRSRNGVEMTKSGRLLRRRAKDMLDQLGRIQHEIRAQADEISGTATVGVPAAVGQLLIPALLGHLARHHPGIRLRTIEGVSAENYDRLLIQTAHICLMYDPLPHRDLVLQPIAVEDMFLIGSAQMLEALERPCDLTDLENLPMILPTAPNSRRLLVEKAFTERGIVLNVAAEVDSFVVTRALLSDGQGYSLATLSSIAGLPAESPFSYSELGPERISWVLSMGYRATSAGDQIVQAVAEALQRVSAELISSGLWKGARLPAAVRAE